MDSIDTYKQRFTSLLSAQQGGLFVYTQDETETLIVSLKTAIHQGFASFVWDSYHGIRRVRLHKKSDTLVYADWKLDASAAVSTVESFIEQTCEIQGDEILISDEAALFANLSEFSRKAARSSLLDSLEEALEELSTNTLQLLEAEGRQVCVFALDVPAYLKESGEDRPDPDLVRLLISVSRGFSHKGHNIVLVSDTSQVEPRLEKDFTQLNYPAPSLEDTKALVESMMDSVDDVEKARAARVLLGSSLTAQIRALNAAKVSTLPLAEALRVGRRRASSGWYSVSEPAEDQGFASLSGLYTLRQWMQEVSISLDEDAIPSVKGAMLTGPPGTGKTSIATAIAADLNYPLVSVKTDALLSKWFGESEERLRKCLEVASAMGNCVLFFDEVDKIFSIKRSGGNMDSMLSALMSWMQAQEGCLVLFATNEPWKVPPALYRKGRLDEVFDVSYTTPGTAARIFDKAAPGHEVEESYLLRVLSGQADNEEGPAFEAVYTSSEVKSLAHLCVRKARLKGDSKVTKDILTDCLFAPQKNSAAEHIQKMTEWSSKYARKVV